MIIIKIKSDIRKAVEPLLFYKILSKNVDVIYENNSLVLFLFKKANC